MNLKKHKGINMYQAVITAIRNVRKHPNADRLMLGTALGFQVVVGLDTVEGTLGVYFPTDGKLSAEMLVANDLVARKDENGNRAGGFFDSKGKVKTQKFRGAESEGFWTNLSALAWTGVDLSTLTEGMMFTELNGHVVCERYETQATQSKKTGNKVRGKMGSTRYFPKHVETEQYRFMKELIPAGSKIYISEKLHGTSHREGNVLTELELPLWKRLINKVYPAFKTEEYKRTIGTRNVILADALKDNDFYGNDLFRRVAMAGVQLPKGMVVYGELVGYVDENTPIMNDHNTGATKDKEVRKLYGDTIRYTYGCDNGESKLFVYRIIMVNDDGSRIDFSVPDMQKWAKASGLQSVPLFYEYDYDGDLDKLDELVESMVDGVSTIDNQHIREGIVLRIETPDGHVYFLKHKSFLFRVLEGIAKEDDTVIDIEEAS